MRSPGIRIIAVAVLTAALVTGGVIAWWPSNSSNARDSNARDPNAEGPNAKDGASNAGQVGGQIELSERVMASKGFLPPGAPVTPPARPTPRRGARPADFADLAGFEFEIESATVPDAIEALRGQVIEVIGVMYFSVEDPDRVAEFYLMPNHMICCFGTPRINQIVDVRLPAGSATRYTLDYYLVRGVLEIGPFFDEDGLALCLYRIANAEVEFME